MVRPVWGRVYRPNERWRAVRPAWESVYGVCGCVGVRQAVHRVERAGATSEVHREGQLDNELRRDLFAVAAHQRGDIEVYVAEYQVGAYAAAQAGQRLFDVRGMGDFRPLVHGDFGGQADLALKSADDE